MKHKHNAKTPIEDIKIGDTICLYSFRTYTKKTYSVIDIMHVGIQKRLHLGKETTEAVANWYERLKCWLLTEF